MGGILSWAKGLLGGPRIDPEIYNTAVFVCRHVMDGAPVRFVARDPGGLAAFCDENGHQHEVSAYEDGAILCVGHLIERDPSVAILPVMPVRLCASRAAPDAPWEFGDIAEDDDELDADDIPGLTVAEIAGMLVPLPKDAKFYRGRSRLGRDLIIRFESGLVTFPIWTDAAQAQSMLRNFAPKDRLTEMDADRIGAFVSERYPARFILLNPFSDGCGIAEIGMFQRAFGQWRAGGAPKSP